jgi:GTPase SAR1 family protein
MELSQSCDKGPVQRSTEPEVIKILFIGGIGSGKSSTINTITGQTTCKTGDTFIVGKQITEKTQTALYVADRTLQVIDTPNITELHQDKRFRELCKEGFHALILVVPVKEQVRNMKMLNIVEKLLGGDYIKFLIVVFTFKENLKDSSREEFVEILELDLKNFIKRFPKRIVEISNRDIYTEHSATQRESFFKALEDVLQETKGAVIRKSTRPQSRVKCCGYLFLNVLRFVLKLSLFLYIILYLFMTYYDDFSSSIADA